MTRQQSFAKIENELLPSFRKRINEAESIEDIRNTFHATIETLFSKTMLGVLGREQIELLPSGEPAFALAEEVRTRAQVAQVWDASDLSQIIGRFAALASNHYQHLAKKPMKSEAKIRM